MNLFQTSFKKKGKLIIVCLIITICITGCGKNSEKSKSKNDKLSTDGISSANGAENSGNGENILDKYVYVTKDKSVGLGDYKGLTYTPVETEVTEQEIDAAISDTLAYFQDFMDVEELTDDLVSEFYEGIDTVDELRDELKVVIYEQKCELAKEAYEEELLTKLVDNSDIFVDFTDQASQSYSALISHYNAMAVMGNLSLEQYVTEELGLDSETWQEDVAREATILTRRHMVLLAIAEAESITVSDTEYEERIEQYMLYYGYDNRELFEREFTKEYIIRNMTEDSAFDFVMQNALPDSNN